MHPEKKTSWIWNALVGGLAAMATTVGGTILVKFADLPTRLSVVETRTTGLDQRLTSMDGKLDAILGRMER